MTESATTDSLLASSEGSRMQPWGSVVALVAITGRHDAVNGMSTEIDNIGNRPQ